LPHYIMLLLGCQDSDSEQVGLLVGPFLAGAGRAAGMVVIRLGGKE